MPDTPIVISITFSAGAVVIALTALVKAARWMGHTETSVATLEKQMDKGQSSLKEQLEASQSALQTQLNTIIGDLREIRKALNNRRD